MLQHGFRITPLHRSSADPSGFGAVAGSSRWSLANFRQAWTCAGLSRGTLRVLQDFNPCVSGSVLLMVFFETECQQLSPSDQVAWLFSCSPSQPYAGLLFYSR
ncbi:hypothetical protein ILYODFUR_030881 [Ilyodon furcidens]|uniref:Uncharacterized protein n=1 Tax=Ilyodon furcidens TaxID=33524 RepID=A0ABV0TSB2_9TELE